jgi:hypothetical protein
MDVVVLARDMVISTASLAIRVQLSYSELPGPARGDKDSFMMMIIIMMAAAGQRRAGEDGWPAIRRLRTQSGCRPQLAACGGSLCASEVLPSDYIEVSSLQEAT